MKPVLPTILYLFKSVWYPLNQSTLWAYLFQQTVLMLNFMKVSSVLGIIQPIQYCSPNSQVLCTIVFACRYAAESCASVCADLEVWAANHERAQRLQNHILQEQIYSIRTMYLTLLLPNLFLTSFSPPLLASIIDINSF